MDSKRTSRSTRIPSSSTRSSSPRRTPPTATPCRASSTLPTENPPEIVGDAAYGGGATRAELREAGLTVVARVPPMRNATGGFPKDRFRIDLASSSVTCPTDNTVPIRHKRHGGVANFAPHCGTCPLASSCTTSRSGRTITIHRYEAILQQARAEQAEPSWGERYRADRPMVERTIAHLVFRAWGGRRARTRGLRRVATDLDTRATAIDLARLAVLGLFRARGLERRWELNTRGFGPVAPREARHHRYRAVRAVFPDETSYRSPKCPICPPRRRERPLLQRRPSEDYPWNFESEGPTLWSAKSTGCSW